jgi:hypoxanthine phosphoribosyltransferase
MIKKYYYSWSQLRKDVVKLAKKLRRYKFDYLVVIARGGMIPASLLSYYLKIKKIRVISYSHYKADAVPDRLKLVLPLDKKIKNKKVLLVDDVVDTGQTMAKAYQTLIRRKNKVITAVLHYKKCLKPIFKPDYYVSDPGNVWIVYPWEV